MARRQQKKKGCLLPIIIVVLILGALSSLAPNKGADKSKDSDPPVLASVVSDQDGSGAGREKEQTTAPVRTPRPTQTPRQTSTPRSTTTPKPKATAAPTQDPRELYTDLQKGSIGEDVKRLQERLIQLGYLDDVADGSFGNKTRAAVVAYQEKNGFDTDGIATAALQAGLFASGALSVQGVPMMAYNPNDFSTPPPNTRATAKARVTPKPEATTRVASSSVDTSSGSYVGNANTRKFHISSCSSVNQMKESNRVFFNSRDAAISAGYTPCKKCHP